jgi:outer membrane receptor for Fe3+-dicitrate
VVSLRPKRYALVPLVTLVLCFVVAESALATDDRKGETESERTARIQELEKQKTAVLQEIRDLRARTEGTAQSAVPRSEMENQPTRSPKESLESVPGVAVRQGGTSRSQELSIRGIAQ